MSSEHAPTAPQKQKHVLAIASAGGHWMQLMQLRPAFAHHRVSYLTTLDGLADQSGVSPAWTVPDCNRDAPVRAVICLFRIGWHILRLRPDVVITTGALPGVIALALGRVIRARTIWVDSVANAEELSASGRLARRFADLRLSQWEEAAAAEGADYAGALL